LNTIRNEIDRLLQERKPDAVGDLPGICVVKSMQDVAGDCSCYVFNDIFALDIQNMWETYLHAKEHWEMVEEPLSGDLVIYYQDIEKSPKHFGVVRGPGLIESKFGYAHVYRHPLFAVPTFYGDIVRYYRKPKGNIK